MTGGVNMVTLSNTFGSIALPTKDEEGSFGMNAAELSPRNGRKKVVNRIFTSLISTWLVLGVPMESMSWHKMPLYTTT